MGHTKTCGMRRRTVVSSLAAGLVWTGGCVGGAREPVGESGPHLFVVDHSGYGDGATPPQADNHERQVRERDHTGSCRSRLVRVITNLIVFEGIKADADPAVGRGVPGRGRRAACPGV